MIESKEFVNYINSIINAIVASLTETIVKLDGITITDMQTWESQFFKKGIHYEAYFLD